LWFTSVELEDWLNTTSITTALNGSLADSEQMQNQTRVDENDDANDADGDTLSAESQLVNDSSSSSPKFKRHQDQQTSSSSSSSSSSAAASAADFQHTKFGVTVGSL